MTRKNRSTARKLTCHLVPLGNRDLEIARRGRVADEMRLAAAGAPGVVDIAHRLVGHDRDGDVGVDAQALALRALQWLDHRMIAADAVELMPQVKAEAPGLVETFEIGDL